MKQLLLLLALILTNSCSLYAQEIIQNLDRRMETHSTLLCVGLDPDPEKMPLEIISQQLPIEERVFCFLKEVVDITADHVCCYKVQKAFFDGFDGGHRLLEKLFAYIHQTYSTIPVFIDCKIGETDNTMQAYMQNLFGAIQADGVVINPYMGDDVFEPFLKDPKKVAIVLAQTSNPRAAAVQELLLANGKPLWEEIIDLAIQRWNKNKNLILVLSSNTTAVNYPEIRQRIPQDMPILLAGIGAQGGNPKILYQLLDNNKRGVFVNSSRGILYPYEITDVNWREAILQATLELKGSLNQIRFEGGL